MNSSLYNSVKVYFLLMIVLKYVGDVTAGLNDPKKGAELMGYAVGAQKIARHL